MPAIVVLSSAAICVLSAVMNASASSKSLFFIVAFLSNPCDIKNGLFQLNGLRFVLLFNWLGVRLFLNICSSTMVSMSSGITSSRDFLSVLVVHSSEGASALRVNRELVPGMHYP